MITDRDKLRFDVIDDDMVEVLRQKTPAQRLASAHAMWRYAHARLNTLLRREHPNWTESQLKSEIARRTLGSD